MAFSQLALAVLPLKSFLGSAVSKFHLGAKTLAIVAKADPMVRGALLVLGGELLGGVGREVAVVVSATVMGDAMAAKARVADTGDGLEPGDGREGEAAQDDSESAQGEAPDAA